ncbi:hypothetical protein M8542_26390 [Amycolatopsis sp. OK19-0408]|uniref:DUF3558 domain-containing protein n=1 Tax=Amycolatopsis iheyensis TaxID=2945988 RepID=A0A9X2NGJ0_9PSEU|nr:hypothetical protein [Amycolatopsis iheyensis]MCR6486362.1 hypothetical protein [Amycolatopsis iheyensis]
MSRVVACVLVVFVAACAPSPAPPPATTSASASASTSASKPKPTPTAPAFTPAASPEKVSAACPFLSGEEITKTIAGADTYSGKEQPGPKGRGLSAFRCAYSTGSYPDNTVITLDISVTPRRLPAAVITKTLEGECDTPATPLPGVGEAAWFCPPGQAKVLVTTARTSHGETRVAQLRFIMTTHTEVYSALAKLVADRL